LLDCYVGASGPFFHPVRLRDLDGAWESATMAAVPFGSPPFESPLVRHLPDVQRWLTLRDSFIDPFALPPEVQRVLVLLNLRVEVLQGGNQYLVGSRTFTSKQAYDVVLAHTPPSQQIVEVNLYIARAALETSGIRL